jgi:hypothetical protein
MIQWHFLPSSPRSGRCWCFSRARSLAGMFSSAFFVMKSENIGWRGGRRGVEGKKSAGKLSIRTFKEIFFRGALKSEKSINESRAFKFLIKKRFRRKIDAQRFADNDIERGFARVMEKFVN